MTGNGGSSIIFSVTTYRGAGSQIQTSRIPEGDTGKIEVQGFDYMHAPVWGAYGFRTRAGEWVEHQIEGSGLGPVAFGIVRAVQRRPGLLLTPKDIADMSYHWTLLDPNVLAARLRVIRAAHDESGQTPRLFLSQRKCGYRISWPRSLTWIWIDRTE